jgi:prepilin peptidase CpaA
LHSHSRVRSMDLRIINPDALWPMIALVGAATITDLRNRRIPNRLVAPFLVLGFLSSGILHGWHGIWQSVLGVLLAAVIQGVPCYFGWMGMGDLKLCAAIGAWVGPLQLITALAVTAILGALTAVAWAAAAGFLGEALRGAAGLMFGHGKGMTLDNPVVRKMPYAPVIALGTICSFMGRQA